MDWKEFDESVSAYKDSVNSTISELAELTEEANRYSGILDRNDKHHQTIESAKRKIANLKSERQALFADWGQASFESDHLRLQEIEGTKAEIDREIEALEQSIVDARENLETLDGVAIAEMVARVDDLSVPVLERFTNPTFSKPIQGRKRLPAFLDVLRQHHEQIKRDVFGGARTIREMQPWSLYYSRELALS